MTARCALVACVVTACLVAASAAWAADPASVMPADADTYVALDLDSLQGAADQVLPQLSQDYWAKAHDADSLGLAVLAAGAPLIQAQLTAGRWLLGPKVGVAIYHAADLYGTFLPDLMSLPARSVAPKPPTGKAPRPRIAPAAIKKALAYLDIVVAAEIRDPAQAKPFLDALASALKPTGGKDQPPVVLYKTDRWVIAATKAPRLANVKAVMAGTQPSLASLPAYQEVMAALPPGAVSVSYADVARFGPKMMEEARKAFEKSMAAAEKPKPAPKGKAGTSRKPAQLNVPGPTDALMKKYMALYWRIAGQWYGAVRGMGAASYLDRRQIESRDVYLLDAAKMAKVPVLGRLSQPVPMTGEVLQALPASSLAVVAAGGVGGQVRGLLDDLAKLDPSLAVFVNMAGQMQGAIGIGLDQDLLPAMERDAAIALLALEVKNPMPVRAAAVFQGHDEAAVSALAAKLDTVLAERFQMKLDRWTAGSVSFRQFTPPGAPFSVCYAPVGDLLLVTTGKEALEQCLAARADPSQSLAASPEIKALMAGPGASALGFVSARGVVAQVAPLLPAEAKPVIGDSIGLDTIAFAVSGDAQRQTAVSQMRGDAVVFAEKLAQGITIAAREALLEALKSKPSPPAKPAPAKPAPKKPVPKKAAPTKRK